MERGFEILVVWSLVTSSFVQCVIHLRTFWTVHNQRATEDLGIALNRRELSLGIKNVFRTLFDLVLAVIVTWGVYIIGQPGRMALYLSVSIATFAAVWYGLRFIRELNNQSLGYAAESKDQRDMRQDTRSEEQDERGEFQDQRGWEQSREGLRMDKREHDITEHEHDLDDREDSTKE